ncbi:MAG: hypothetical protein GY798_28825 [Hyphomicrobiales bacterium]|nr:hypothetical protein [Hyphomicrobiales bacterium]
MNIWFHSAIAGMSLVAMVAVAAAGVAVYEGAPDTPLAKTDFLPLTTPSSEPSRYATVEARDDGRSTLSRFTVPATTTN